MARSAPIPYSESYLPSGLYTVTTVKMPAGYIQPEVQKYYVRQAAEVQTFVIPMCSAKASIRAVNADTNKTVKDVKLILRSPDGSTYATWRTTKKGWKAFKPITPAESQPVKR